MTFIEYLRTKKQPDSPTGDFIGDVLRDKDFPEAVGSADSLAGYLARKGAGDDVIRIGRRVWEQYEKAAGEARNAKSSASAADED